MKKSKVGKNSKGITLVALVVTIVVLLILAGITIMYVMGENSVFKQAGDAKLNTELAKIEEQASLIYTDKLLQKAQNNNNLKEKPTMQEIVEELRNKGYEIEQVAGNNNEITGISLDKESIRLDLEETNTIQVTFEGNSEPYTYYAKIEGKYYKMHLNGGVVTIDRTESDISDLGESTAPTLTVTSGDETIATATVNNDINLVIVTALKKYGTTTITIIYGEYTKTCNIIVEEAESDWAEIAEMAKAIANDSSITSSSTQATVTVNEESKTIKVGDIYKVKYNGEIKPVRVLGFKHDDLVNTGIYGGNHSKAGITFDFVDFMTGTEWKSMDVSGTNSGGWAATQMRKDLNGYTTEATSQSGAIGGLGANLSNKNYIKQVKKKYIPTYNQASTSTSNDYLWMLSCSEIVNSGYQANAYGKAITTEGPQYQYYKTMNPTWNQMNTGLIKKGNSTASANYWWLRSPFYGNSHTFCYVSNSGDVEAVRLSAGSFCGVAPGFSV